MFDRLETYANFIKENRFCKYLKDKEVVKADSIPVKITEQKMSVELLNREATRIKVTIKEPVVTGGRVIGNREYVAVYLGNENLVREEESPFREKITERDVGYTLASGSSVMASCFAMKNRFGLSVYVHTPEVSAR